MQPSIKGWNSSGHISSFSCHALDGQTPGSPHLACPMPCWRGENSRHVSSQSQPHIMSHLPYQHHRPASLQNGANDCCPATTCCDASEGGIRIRPAQARRLRSAQMWHTMAADDSKQMNSVQWSRLVKTRPPSSEFRDPWVSKATHLHVQTLPRALGLGHACLKNAPPVKNNTPQCPPVFQLFSHTHMEWQHVQAQNPNSRFEVQFPLASAQRNRPKTQSDDTGDITADHCACQICNVFRTHVLPPPSPPSSTTILQPVSSAQNVECVFHGSNSGK